MNQFLRLTVLLFCLQAATGLFLFGWNHLVSLAMPEADFLDKVAFAVMPLIAASVAQLFRQPKP